MHVRRARAVAAAATTVALAAALVACGGGDDEPAATPTPSPSAAPLLATLNGEEPPDGPVVVVKVDNAPSARPLQRGLAGAQVVYQEVVEGALTRFAAVYVGDDSPQVGPVRSARITDVDLLAEYGPVLFAFSGANPGVRRAVDRSNLISVPQDRNDRAYDLKGSRPEANNFFTDTKRLIDAAPEEGAPVKDVGFRFGDIPSGGRAVNGEVTVRFNGISYVTFAYDAAQGGWTMTQNSRTMKLADGETVRPVNVIVQFVQVAPGKFHDKLGNNSPDSRTVGTGRAVVFRDGKRFKGKWSRSAATAPTRFTDAAGKDIALQAGGLTWVLLVPTDGKVRLK